MSGRRTSRNGVKYIYVIGPLLTSAALWTVPAPAQMSRTQLAQQQEPAPPVDPRTRPRDGERRPDGAPPQRTVQQQVPTAPTPPAAPPPQRPVQQQVPAVPPAPGAPPPQRPVQQQVPAVPPTPGAPPPQRPVQQQVPAVP
ncbi:MAG: hypothetical protein HY056_12900, partial [Proteobacteria bacterium]|nr:hypothetical protein [Pseudomonadota bacterium]